MKSSLNLVCYFLRDVSELAIVNDAVVVVVEDQEYEVNILRRHVGLHEPF